MSAAWEVAIIDQATAAQRDIEAFEAALDGRPGYRRQTTPGPAMARRMAAAEMLGAAGDMTACAHLAAGPQAAYWWAWEPGRIWCGPCAKPLADAVDREPLWPCDGCRRPVPSSTLTLNSHLVMSAYAPLDGGQPVAAPVLFRCALCPLCQQLEDVAMRGRT